MATDRTLRLPARFGRYILDERIGAGGMAEVYRARLSGDPGANGAMGFEKVVCIKRILPHLAEAPDFAAMFRDEAAIAARLQHANIVQIFDFGEVDGSLFIAMEFIDGISLAKLLQTYVKRGEILPVAAVLKVGVEVAKGLRHAHLATKDGKPLGIVHRDVTPHNILVSKAGEVRIADFGVARADGRRTHTQTGVIKGKLQYMAPEQALGKPFDHRLDQFALGIVLHEALTGRRLFKGGSEFLVLEAVARAEVKPPSSLRREIPPSVDAVVLRALQKDADKRWKDMGAFENALSECLFEVARNPKALDLVPIVARARNPRAVEEPAPPTVTAKLPAGFIPDRDPFDDDGETARLDSSAEWVKAGDTPQMGAQSVTARASNASQPALRVSRASGSITAPTLAADQGSPAVTPGRIAAGLVVAGLVAAVLGVAVGHRGRSASTHAVTAAAGEGGCPARYAPLGSGCFPKTELAPNLDGLGSSCGADAVTSSRAGAKPVAVFARMGAAGDSRVVVERTEPGVLVLAAEKPTTWTVDALLGSPPSHVYLVGKDQVVTGLAPGVNVDDLGPAAGVSLAAVDALLAEKARLSSTGYVACKDAREFLLGEASRPSGGPAPVEHAGRSFALVDDGAVSGRCDGQPARVLFAPHNGLEVVMLAAGRAGASAAGGRIHVEDERTAPHALLLGGGSPTSWDVDAGPGLEQIVAVGSALQSVHAPKIVRLTQLSGSPSAFAWEWSDPKLPTTWSAARAVTGADVAAYAWCDAGAEFKLEDGPLSTSTRGPAASVEELAAMRARLETDAGNPAAACADACAFERDAARGPLLKSALDDLSTRAQTCETCRARN